MTTALMVRRCGCGEEMPNPFDVRCGECARAGLWCYLCGGPALGQTLCERCAETWVRAADWGDLDDYAEAEHFRLVDIEADLKDEGQRLDPDRAW